jgi:hypothetical protein
MLFYLLPVLARAGNRQICDANAGYFHVQFTTHSTLRGSPLLDDVPVGHVALVEFLKIFFF